MLHILYRHTQVSIYYILFCLFLFKEVHVYILYTHICIHTHIHIHPYTHTHTHKHIRELNESTWLGKSSVTELAT